MMTKRDLALAALHVGTGIGYRVCADDREEDFDELRLFGAQYVSLAMQMVEAAFNMVMAYPENYLKGCYDDFGDWIVYYGADHDNDPPSHEEVIEYLVDSTISEFSELLTKQQKDTLRTQLEHIGKEYNTP